MDAIWSKIDRKLSLLERKNYFLKVLRKLLNEKHVRLGWHFTILNESNDELIAKLEEAWPNDSDFDEILFSTVLPYKQNDEGILCTHYWIIGDLVWLDDDGDMTWSTNAEMIL